MYKFPEDFDAKVLIGAVLEMICFSKNQIAFHFGDDISITAESDILYRKPTGIPSEVMITVPCIKSDLMRLLEHEITLAAVEKFTILTLTFDTGDALSFCDVAENFESYSLTIKGHTIAI